MLSVTRVEVPPLDSDLGQGAGEEANSPAGGARGVGGGGEGGRGDFISIKIMISSMSAFSET